MFQAQALNGLLDGDLGAVGSAASQGARLSREAGDLYSLGMMLLNQGFAALVSGDLRESGQRLAEGLRIARQLDDRVAQCHLLGGLSCCAAGRASHGWPRSSSERWRTSAPRLGPASMRACPRHWIGGRLFISERTVESHVRSILNKLVFNSRAQIAGWMAAPDR